MPRAKSATIDLKVRMKEPLRACIEEAAREHGVSMNAEIVNRLARTFREEETAYAIFGSKLRYRQMQLLAVTVQLIEEQTGHKWTDDFETAEAVRAAFASFVEMFAKGEVPKGINRVTAGPSIGEATFWKLVESVRDADRKRDQGQTSQEKE